MQLRPREVKFCQPRQEIIQFGNTVALIPIFRRHKMEGGLGMDLTLLVSLAIIPAVLVILALCLKVPVCVTVRFYFENNPSRPSPLLYVIRKL
jgi:hypothetical protein